MLKLVGNMVLLSSVLLPLNIVNNSYIINVKAHVLAEFRKSAMQRATYEHLKGKVLDVFPDYKKEAEDHLSKAVCVVRCSPWFTLHLICRSHYDLLLFQVKLNPSLTDAWLSLGNCFWKKGDLVSAKNCFTRALSKVITFLIFSCITA